MLDAILSCKFLTHKFVNLGTQAVSSQPCRILLDNALDILTKEVEEQLKKEWEGHLVKECDTQVIPQESNQDLSVARLKEKSPQKKGSKRKSTWIDRQHKKWKTRQTEVKETQELPTACYLYPEK